MPERESVSWIGLGYRNTLFFIKQNRMEAGTRGMRVGGHLVKTQRLRIFEFPSRRKQLELKDIRDLFFFSCPMVYK